MVYLPLTHHMAMARMLLRNLFTLPQLLERVHMGVPFPYPSHDNGSDDASQFVHPRPLPNHYGGEVRAGGPQANSKGIQGTPQGHPKEPQRARRHPQ